MLSISVQPFVSLFIGCARLGTWVGNGSVHQVAYHCASINDTEGVSSLLESDFSSNFGFDLTLL